MLEKAIEKLKSEMDENKNNSYVQVVGNFLVQHITENPDEAEKILTNDKTVLKSLGEMRKVAEKRKTGNFACIDPQEGFSIVMKYFGIKTDYVEVAKIHEASKLEVQNKEVSEEKPKAVAFNVSLNDLL